MRWTKNDSLALQGFMDVANQVKQYGVDRDLSDAAQKNQVYEGLTPEEATQQLEGLQQAREAEVQRRVQEAGGSAAEDPAFAQNIRQQFEPAVQDLQRRAGLGQAQYYVGNKTFDNKDSAQGFADNENLRGMAAALTKNGDWRGAAQMKQMAKQSELADLQLKSGQLDLQDKQATRDAFNKYIPGDADSHTAARDALIKAGRLEAAGQLDNFHKNWQEEGFGDAIKAIRSGDSEGAFKAFNKSGQYKFDEAPTITAIKDAKGNVIDHKITGKINGQDASLDSLNTFEKQTLLKLGDRLKIDQDDSHHKDRMGIETKRLGLEGQRVGIDRERLGLEGQRVKNEGRRLDIEEKRDKEDRELRRARLGMELDEKAGKKFETVVGSIAAGQGDNSKPYESELWRAHGALAGDKDYQDMVRKNPSRAAAVLESNVMLNAAANEANGGLFGIKALGGKSPASAATPRNWSYDPDAGEYKDMTTGQTISERKVGNLPWDAKALMVQNPEVRKVFLAKAKDAERKEEAAREEGLRAARSGVKTWYSEDLPTDISNEEGTPNFMANGLNGAVNFFRRSARQAQGQ